MKLVKIESRLKELERTRQRLLFGLLLIILIIFSMFFLARYAKAQNNITIVRAPGEHAVTVNQALQISIGGIDLMHQSFAESSTNLSIKRLLLSPSHFQDLNHIDTRYGYFEAWQNHIRNNAPYKGNKILLVAPPIRGPGGFYLGGISSVCPTKPTSLTLINALAASIATGENRLEHSQVAVAHELGHLLGARHDSSGYNIMHPAALSEFNRERIPPRFFLRAKRQMISCRVRQKRAKML